MRVSIDKLMKSERVFERNEAIECPDGQERCHLCGRPAKTQKWIEVVGYGCEVADDKETLKDGESLGLFVVGPTCFKRVKQAFGGSYPVLEPCDSWKEMQKCEE